MPETSRRPAGSPTGGQFAARAGTHPETSLDAPTAAMDTFQWCDAARSPDVNPETLHRCLDPFRHRSVRITAASNPSADPAHLDRALEDPDWRVRKAAAGNPSAQPHQIDWALGDPDVVVCISAASNPSAQPHQIDRALSHQSDAVRRSAALNPSATPEHVSKALADPDHLVRQSAVHSDSLRQHHLDEMLASSDGDLCRIAERLRREGTMAVGPNRFVLRNVPD